jgi:ribose 5-phosphate isomerase A
MTNPKLLAASKLVSEFLPKKGVIGLGTGSTAGLAIDLIGQGDFDDIQAVATSQKSCTQAKNLGINLLQNFTEIDFSFDGADWVDTSKNLIKGMGGALTREKIVAEATKEYFILVDESKLTNSFEGKIIPIEVLRYGLEAIQNRLEKIGTDSQILRLNSDKKPYITDNGNFILDCTFAKIPDLRNLATQIKNIAGVLDHGLFLGFNPTVIVGYKGGEVEVR